ncbi:MAG: glycosyltransferase family 4 protein [Deltaproteobacteria bacterium]|nr:glycosyltransferase family 4 protein [Deltaproteobacteria bacterium]
MLYLALIPGDYVGWGVCSRYLIREIGKLTETMVISAEKLRSFENKVVDGKVFHTIGDHNLTRIMNIAGIENYGYTFFENLLPGNARENASFFDVVFAGSTWCRERLVENGITWSDVLIQGIDPDLFYPVEGEKAGAREYFVIFSGGKFELRKGQDIVIRAVKVMQERHKDILFVNCWHNVWPFSMNTMVKSPWIRFRPQKRWDFRYLKQLLSQNGVDLNRTEILPLIPQDQLRRIYACTDVGLFPNRCEGGTNLVLMEYMACGKPVVASYNSGHKDILNESNSLCLKQMSSFELRDDVGRLVAVWDEPSLEEVIESLEYAYSHRDILKRLGKQAGEDMKNMTWGHTAKNLTTKLGVGRS